MRGVAVLAAPGMAVKAVEAVAALKAVEAAGAARARLQMGCEQVQRSEAAGLAVRACGTKQR
jgi:hypothetical protein